MKYKICDYAHDPGHVYYVNADSTSPEDSWTSMLSLNAQNLQELPIPPKLFENKKEAKEYLDAAKSGSLYDWNKNSWYYKAHGSKKPSWKIYEVNQ